MKKLLALLLCAALLSGVIPAAAFAAETGVDLGPAYEALESLDNAYAQLAAAVVMRNALDGLSAVAGLFDPGGDAFDQAMDERDYWIDSAQWWFEQIMDRTGGISYAELFELLGEDVCVSFEWVGCGVVEDASAAIAELQDEAAAGAVAEQEKIVAGIEKTIAENQAALFA